MFILVQIAAATLLVGLSATVVLGWLLLLALSFTGGLMPWTAAGIVQYGLILFGFAALPGIPGVLWAYELAQHSPPASRRFAMILVWGGTVLLALGLVTALVMLVV